MLASIGKNVEMAKWYGVALVRQRSGDGLRAYLRSNLLGSTASFFHSNHKKKRARTVAKPSGGNEKKKKTLFSIQSKERK